jgi:hypothetical protein
MRSRLAILTMVIAAMAVTTFASEANAFYRYRQYYSSWNYQPSRSYYTSQYYYRPTPTYPTYSYHYCVYRPSQPRYVYYYNTHTRKYWGRFDCQGTEGHQYSLLKAEDQKGSLEEIPEKAFPAPGKMPQIPDATDPSGTKSDGGTVQPIDPKSLPDLAAPVDLPSAVQ